MEQTILGFAGKKQAGKNTSYSCVRLWRPEAQEFSFADSLKRVCIDVLGLEENQAYGTDDDKNTLVPHLLWDNFPLQAWAKESGGIFIGQPDNVRFKIQELPPDLHVCGDAIPFKPGTVITNFINTYSEVNEHICSGVQFPSPASYNPNETWNDGVKLTRKQGPMTAREVLQYWGTEIFRRQYHDVWADACIRKIRKSGCRFAVITDCRFPNEVEAVQKAGGKVIKLTRVVFPDDTHPSETALDPEHFDRNKFDAILHNSEMSVDEQCESLYSILRRWGVVGHKSVKRIHV